MIVDTSLLAGRYRLLRRIGSGGAGSVWHATDEVLGRAVAVKLLHDDLQTDGQAVARFRREAVAAAALNHAHAVAIYDIGTESRDSGDEDSERTFLVMELIDGPPLSRLLGRTLPVDATVALGHGVGSALGAAHRRSLVHRDVKPGNVLVGRNGAAKVADFGIATAVGDARTQLTAAGTVLGTAAYLAPEQVRGDAVDARADVYALGLILHEALTGQRPFGSGTAIEIATRRLSVDPPPVTEARPDLPGGLADVLACATHRDPSERYPDGAAFAAALEAWLPARPDAAVARLLDVDDATQTVALRPDTLDAPTTRVAGGAARDDTARFDAVVDGPQPTHPRESSAVDEAMPEPTRDGPPVPAPQREDEPGASTPDADTVVAAETHPPRPRWRRRRTLAVLAAIVAAVALGTAGLLALGGPDPAPAGPETEAGEDPSGAWVVASAQDLDPFGDGSEHARTVPAATDGDPSTAWQSERYNSRDFGGLKPGVGLMFDLGELADVSELDLRFTRAGLDAQVFVGDEPPSGDDPAAWGELVAEVDDASEQETLEVDATGRYWTLWITELPPGGRAEVAEVSFG